MVSERRLPSMSSDQAPLTGFASRRGSLVSLGSRQVMDRGALSQVLDDIHISASKSDSLTCFSDFDPVANGRAPGPKELVTGRLSGIYNRLKQSVGASSSDPAARPSSRSSFGPPDNASVRSNSSVAFKHASHARSGSSLSATNGPNLGRASADIVSTEAPKLDHDARKPDELFATTKLAGEPALSRDSSLVSTGKARVATQERGFSEMEMLDSPVPLQEAPTSNVADSKPNNGTAQVRDEPAASEEEVSGEPTSAAVKADKRMSVQSVQSRQSLRTPDYKSTSGLVRRTSLATPSKLPTPILVRKEEPAQTNQSPRSTAVSPSALRSRGRVASQSHLPGYKASRTSSTTDGGEDPSKSGISYGVAKSSHDSPPNLIPQYQRPLHKQPDTASKGLAVMPAHLKRRVVSKEFWMKDENARDCFYCGDAFSTFRRKHHCRTCGQIFDAKCTTLVPGRPFDQPGTLRLCTPCEATIYGSDDDSTIFTDDEDGHRAAFLRDESKSGLAGFGNDGAAQFKPEQTTLVAPSMGIPVSRRNRESKRRSAVIEFDTFPALARPSSSRSLKSLSGRPRSSSHRRHQSRLQGIRGMKQTNEERGPFYQEPSEMSRRVPLPAFHNDNIIDPELAPFMSDEGSEDGHPSLFATLNADGQGSSPIDAERAGLSSLLASAVKKGRTRFGDRSVGTPSVVHRDSDAHSVSGRLLSRTSRRRNASMGSVALSRPSPRRSRSQHLLKDVGEVHAAEQTSVPPLILPPNPSGTKLKRSAAMRGSNAPAMELNRASLQHVRKLLSQLLHDGKVPDPQHWEKALLPILLQCTDDVDPDVMNGDDMDVRNYIKLKKTQGGRPGDTSYISGVVFSKNVALKSMERCFAHPRIVIVTFAIEYARHNQHFISLEPVIAQEREYLRSMVGRIAALSPQVLLVQRNVSGLALQMLNERGITVVYNVKDTVLAAVARVTQTSLIKSVDKLSIDPAHLGQCENFEVKTYVHSGVKKTYVYISGCLPSLGCTIVLRGANTETLRQVKRITEFMCYVVYNLKLETCLMRDEWVLMPSLDDGAINNVTAGKMQPVSNLKAANSPVQSGYNSADRVHESDSDAMMPTTSQPPRLNADQSDTGGNSNPGLSDGNTAADSTSEASTIPSQYQTLVETSRTKIRSSSPLVKYVEPYLLIQAQESERKVLMFKRLRDGYLPENDEKWDEKEDYDAADFEMVQPEMIEAAQPQLHSRAVRDVLFDAHNVQYQRALHEYETKKKQWDSFFEGSNGDPFDPFRHQNIFVLESLVSTITSAPCTGPEVVGYSFYGAFSSEELNTHGDCTLGQFVEELCGDASTACKTCNRKMFDHHHQYVHGSGQLSISVKRYPARIKGLSNSVLMWATCKKCDQETAVIPMSDNTWKYSLGKYLELSFWSTPLKPRAGLCSHDIHKDFVRCFGFRDLCVRVQYDKIEIYDVHVPSSTVNWAVSSDLRLKNQLYSESTTKLTAFVASIKARISSINLSTVAPEKSAEATAAIEKLVQRAQDDHVELLSKLQTKYMSCRFYEVIPLNRAMRYMDEKAISWDIAFADFERDYFPSETDIRRLATLQLKKLFLDRNETATAHSGDAGDADMGLELQERTPTRGMSFTDEELQSERGQNMLTAVVEEHSHAIVNSAMPPEHLGMPRSADAALDQNSLSRTLTPDEREQAVEAEGVKHLDLALPIVPAEPSTMSGVSESLEDARQGSALSEEDVAASEPKPLTSTILERIEQIRSAAAGPATDESVPESRIPRFIDLHKRTVADLAAPPFARTQSQPVHVPGRINDLQVELPLPPTISGGDLSGTEGITTSPQDRGQGKDMAKLMERRLNDRLGTVNLKTLKAQQSLIPRSVPQKTEPYNPTRVSALAKHFEQLSREFERERLRERRQRAARSRQNRANPLASSQPVVEVYRDASEAVGARADELKVTTGHAYREQSPTRYGPEEGYLAREPPHKESFGSHDTNEHDGADQYTDTEMGGSTLDHAVLSDTEFEGDNADLEHVLDALPRHSDMSDPITGTSSATLLSPGSAGELDLSLPKHEKSSLMKVLTSFWSERSASGWLPLEYPLSQTEHVFDDSDIIVREDEPSSVIALALSSNDYMKKLKEFRGTPKSRSHTHTQSSGSALPLEVAKQQAAIEASLVSETGTHMKYSFAHGQVKAQCKIFYAESFDALRRKCGVSERFVESLSRSVKWDSKGGKTKSLFLKTLDDRFVIKSLQEVELKAFTKFAPDYFAFMSHTLFHGVPSVIAKMFGLFQVMMRNPSTGAEFSSYLLVMENLFYDRKPTRRFDLKGSMRNRKIESTGQPDEVLLDENLVETIFETPLFVREHARKLVKASVWNDTMWLCKQNVMDYSLMAGFDDDQKHLFIGIIDCIRTYTWDKKLESWIKDRGKNKPTITSPRDYRNRFRVSMMQYVLQAPNVYHENIRKLPPPTSLKAIEEQQSRRNRRSGLCDGEGNFDEAMMREMGTIMV